MIFVPFSKSEDSNDSEFLEIINEGLELEEEERRKREMEEDGEIEIEEEKKPEKKLKFGIKKLGIHGVISIGESEIGKKKTTKHSKLFSQHGYDLNSKKSPPPPPPGESGKSPSPAPVPAVRKAKKKRYKTTLVQDKGTYNGEVKETQVNMNLICLKMDGHGKYDYINGNSYEGDFKMNVKEGKGVFHFVNEGNTYNGQWKDDLFHGYGVYDHSSGEKYVGDFVLGKFQGVGKQFYKNGKLQFDGKFKNNKRSGFGIYYYENGSRYIGEWAGGFREGLGVLTDPNDLEWVGWWEKNIQKRVIVFFLFKFL